MGSADARGRVLDRDRAPGLDAQPLAGQPVDVRRWLGWHLFPGRDGTEGRSERRLSQDPVDQRPAGVGGQGQRDVRLQVRDQLGRAVGELDAVIDQPADDVEVFVLEVGDACVGPNPKRRAK